MFRLLQSHLQGFIVVKTDCEKMHGDYRISYIFIMLSAHRRHVAPTGFAVLIFLVSQIIGQFSSVSRILPTPEVQ
jgi:hypothetical protein